MLHKINSLLNCTEIEYTVEVYTGGKMGAGTDSNVFVTLHGNNGDSGFFQINNNNEITNCLLA